MAHHVCPWWMGYFLINPLRRFMQNPKKILGPYISPGMTVLDIGSGMGFFSLPLAKMVGPDGQVLALDLQPKMIKSLNRRAAKAGLSDRIDARICQGDSLGVEDMGAKINFALAFYMVHEVPDKPRFMNQIHSLLAPEGKLYILEPKHHVSESAFLKTETEAAKAGFKPLDRPKIKGSRTLLMEKA